MDALLEQLASSPIKAGTFTVSLATLGYICVKGVYGKSDHKYPPGPPRDPLIGNLRQFPNNRFADAFSRWARQYGKLFFVCPNSGLNRPDSRANCLY